MKDTVNVQLPFAVVFFGKAFVVGAALSLAGLAVLLALGIDPGEALLTASFVAFAVTFVTLVGYGAILFVEGVVEAWRR